MTAERRQTPRLEVLDQLHGRLVALKVPLVVREIGPGGFSIESIVPFPPDSHHQFRFTAGTGDEIVAHAVVVHTRPAGAGGTPARYITGFVFGEGSETTRAAGRLLDAMTSALSFP